MLGQPSIPPDDKPLERGNSRSAASWTAPDSHLVSLTDPTSYEAERYRMLRQMVEQRPRSPGCRVLAVTSPGPQDGKTTTAINLAGALAQAPGARILLVEADLRRPCLLERLGLKGADEPGLVEAVSGSGLSLGDLVRRRPRFNLSVLPSGQVPSTPYEVLRSPGVAPFMKEIRQHFDYVIVDTPPVVPYPDFRLIEPWVDDSLLVVRANRTPRALVQAAIALVDPAHALGIVLNHEDNVLSRYHDSYYRRKRPEPPPSRGAERGPATETPGPGRRRMFFHSRART